ncbi:MAG: hypothetical protein AAF655_20960 [Bacteroidota bacterium]
MRTRVITVPRNQAAEKKLDFDEAEPSELIEWTISEEEYSLIEKYGLFDVINETADVIIDDFESELVRGIPTLTKVLNVLKEKRKRKKYQNLEVLHSLIKLFEEAIARATGVYFFF